MESQNIKYLLDTYNQIRFMWIFLNQQYKGMRGISGDNPQTIKDRYKEYIAQQDEKLERDLGNRMNGALQAVRGKS